MVEHAKQQGCGEVLRNRIRLVADELMMNALYRAPTDESGLARYRNRSPRELASLALLGPISVQFACDESIFGLCVSDGYGSLTRQTLLASLRKADGPIRPSEETRSGAGMGLACALRSASKLLFRIAEGTSTEACALFDRSSRVANSAMAYSIQVDASPGKEIRIPQREAAI